MKVDYIKATTASEIQSAMREYDVLVSNSSVRKWCAPGLATEIGTHSSATSILGEVPYLLDEARREPAKAFYEERLAGIEAEFPEWFDGNHKLGILNTRPKAEVLSFSPADQTVTIQAGMRVRKLNRILADVGQCIPVPECDLKRTTLISTIQSLGSIDSMIYLDLPHILESQCGSWRDWVLGMKLVLPNGEVVTAGSKVVKNVAGFDLHKLMIGSFGTLGVIAEVTLRTFPLQNLPKPEVQIFDRMPNEAGGVRDMYTWVQRTALSDVSSAIEATKPFVREVDACTGTLWGLAPFEIEVPKLPGAWMMCSRAANRNVQIDNSTQIALMRRTKQIFDPTNKLNPGVFGFI